MNRQSLLIFTIIFFISLKAFTQINTGVAVLDKQEQERYRNLIKENKEVRAIHDSLALLANKYLDLEPKPLEVINYEGLLENDPERMKSIESLLDANKVVDLIYATYGSNNTVYVNKIKEFVLAWANTYKASGNPINENKLTPLFWSYAIYKDNFSADEKTIVDNWMLSIAKKEKDRKSTPNNNWQSKRLKIIGIIGCALDNEELKQFSLEGIKKYISSAYYPDGSSNDLKTRDAMHYHSSGIEPLLDMFINLQKFDSRFDQYSYTDEKGVSIEKAIIFMEPYLSGEKTHREWVNTTVALDKEKAEAGLKEYEPGKLYNPKDALPMLNWAVYYQPELFQYVCGCKVCYTCNVEAFFNSPLIRKNN
ncbi:alginate lyase family protein [Galbibacter sp. BG1]|uniref:alginate lyase family protein n=1 Tax=Galbibacter sp. BG1 TaxID=1170699 RepID=UPI0015BF2075|nr:alginate lyase family protein [Galbibacter sp. BG1]QLE02664.1 alginate lyase family protein [Galbibacter sp. BG1]